MKKLLVTSFCFILSIPAVAANQAQDKQRVDLEIERIKLENERLRLDIQKAKQNQIQENTESIEDED